MLLEMVKLTRSALYRPEAANSRRND